MSEYISRDAAAAYIAGRGNRFVNQHGMDIGSYLEDGICTVFAWVGEDDQYQMEIVTSEEGLDDFITGFRIKDVGDIDRLGYNNSWIRYLNGGAEILITPFELEATFTFRIYKSRTTIWCLELHFYDEVSEHLTLEEDFLKYFEQKDDILRNAADSRYRFRRR